MQLLARVLVLLALVAASTAQSDRIRLGTWNLEFFGNRKDPPRTDADIAAMATFLRTRGIDVLAMQEVGTPEAVQTLASHLGAGWQFVLGTTGMWTDGSGGQRVGFLWNSARVELLQAEELMQLPREVEASGRKLPIFHRVPVSAVFRARSGGLDFRAVTVHLKADVRREIEQNGRDELSTRKRVAEAAELGGVLAAMLADASEDRDVVVLGDFNHVLARERSEPAAKPDKPAADLTVPLLTALSGFARVPPAHPRPTIRWFPEAIDHVVVGGDFAEEVIPGSVQVHAPWPGDPTEAELEAWQKTYSDHFMLSVDLDAGRDRDPQATFAPAGAGQALRAVGARVAQDAAAAPPAAGAGTRGTGAVATAENRRRIPFAEGNEVTVELLAALPGRDLPTTYRGRLLHSLPNGSGGFVTLELESGQRVAIPAARIDHITER